MAVIARDGTPSSTLGSAHIAVATVVGMVLGILCLFGMIIAYQLLLPRKRKPSPQMRALAPPPPKPLPLFIRIRTHCTTLFSRIQTRSRATSSDKGESPSGIRHRTLRSFHLSTPERKRERQEMRRKFDSSLRLNLNLKSSSDTFSSSPRTVKRFYSRLDDSDERMLLVKPDTAVISPWSPSEDYYPSTPPLHFGSSRLKCAEFGTPPALSPLPPAYLNNTPLRAGFRQMDEAGGSPMKGDSESSLTSPTLVDGELDIVDGPKSLIEEIQQVLEYTRDWATEDTQLSPFVIGEEDDMDPDTISIYSEV